MRSQGCYGLSEGRWLPPSSAPRRSVVRYGALAPAVLSLLLCLPAPSGAQIETRPVHATHIQPAVAELMARDRERIEGVVQDLALQDVASIEIDVCIEPGAFRLSGTAVLEIASTRPPIELHLNEDLTPLSVTSDGRPLRFLRDGASLMIWPGAQPERVFEVEVSYEGVLSAGPGVWLREGLVLLGGRRWYPSPRHGDRCAIRTAVRYPEGYTSVCTGALAGMTPLLEDADEACVLGDVWDTAVPVASASVAVGTFASTYSIWGDVFLGYHVLVGPDEDTPGSVDAFVPELKELVRYAESCYGAYPFDWLNVIFAPGLPAGLPAVETAPGSVVVSGFALPGAGLNSPRPERVVAGLSRNWWPHSIDAGRIVSEGLAGHAEIAFLAETGSEEAASARREQDRAMYVAALADSGGRAPLRDCMEGDASTDVRVCSTRSQAFMGILEKVVGRGAFCEALKELGGRFRGGMLPFEEFVGAFEAADGRDLDWLVYEWVYRGDLPTYVLTYDVTPRGGRYVVNGTIAQRGEIFRTPVPLIVDLGVWSYEEWVAIGSSDQRFEFETELEPQSIAIDDSGVVPRIGADELARVHFARGERAARANEWGTAVDEFGAASELVPENGEYSFRYGEALVHSGRLELGLAELEGAVDAAPDDADARLALARLYIVSGRSERALPHLDRYVSLRPDDPGGHTARARALTATGRLPAAERALELAESLVDSLETEDGTLERLKLATGRYHEAAGDTSMAAAAYREVLSLNPVSDEARRALARIRGR